MGCQVIPIIHAPFTPICLFWEFRLRLKIYLDSIFGARSIDDSERAYEAPEMLSS